MYLFLTPLFAGQCIYIVGSHNRGCNVVDLCITLGTYVVGLL